MAVTEILADYGWTGLLSKQDNTYRHDVDAWFAPFQQHVAVKRFAELARAGYTFDGPATTMVCLSAPPELKLEGRAEVLKSGDYRARTGVGCRSEARPGISRVQRTRTPPLREQLLQIVSQNQAGVRTADPHVQQRARLRLEHLIVPPARKE